MEKEILQVTPTTPHNLVELSITPGPTSCSGAVTLSSVLPTGTQYFRLQAIGGIMYITTNGSTPSSSNYHATLSQDAVEWFLFHGKLTTMKIIGTSYCVLPACNRAP